MSRKTFLAQVAIPDGYTAFFPVHVLSTGIVYAAQTWVRRNLGHGNHRNRRMPGG